MKKLIPQQLSLDFEDLSSVKLKIELVNYEAELGIAESLNPKKAVVLNFNNARFKRDADLQSEINRRIVDSIRYM